MRLMYEEHVRSKLFRWRTKLRSVRVRLSGWKLAVSNPQLCNFCIHSASLSSSLRPVTFFTCLAFTSQTSKPYSCNKRNNGIQYTPVLSLSLIHISEPTRLGMISYAVFCLKKKKKKKK